MWVAIPTHGLLGPVSFEETVNSERYLNTLRNIFVSHILVIGLPLQTQGFMEDGARHHTAKCCFGLSV
jgi:hypothetical protein